jgi:hypothetical protein
MSQQMPQVGDECAQLNASHSLNGEFLSIQLI